MRLQILQMRFFAAVSESPLINGTYLFVAKTYQLLQFEQTNARNFIKVTILQYTRSYIFRASLTHNQGAHNCTQQVFYLFCVYQPKIPPYLIFT
jgi:Ni,Fe-hydrogenase I cytochrome b subunit